MVIKSGFTLVELVVVMAILAIIIVITVGVFNPVAQMNKVYDVRAKKDVNRIKIAFEEYANDNKGCFPIVNESGDPLGLLSDAGCNTDAFAPWLSTWPCNPKGKHYLIYTEPKACPSWFKVATKLDNLKDMDIPVGISPSTVMGGEITGLTANYGASSTNIKWWDGF
jgi:prepilin-type N-terminal cleavage/methylation domain-containing protein